MRELITPRRASVLALAALGVAIAAWLFHYARLNGAAGFDEVQYWHYARWVAEDPARLFEIGPHWGRGIQRVVLLLLAPGAVLYEAPAALTAGHLLQVLAYTSVVVPAWLLGRGLGLGALEALIPAALCAAVPWAVYSASFLTEPSGYAAFVWAVWGVWRAAVKPSAGGDLLAIALLVLAALTRTGFLLLAPLLPAVAVLQAWRFGGEGALLDRARSFPRTLWRRHPVVTLTIVVGLAILVVDLALPGSPVERLSGNYGAPATFDADHQIRKAGIAGSRIAVGIGVLPVAFGLAWLGGQLVRPRSAAGHAMAATSVLAIAAVLASTLNSSSEERYYMYFAPPLLIATSVALMRLELGRIAVVVGGLAAAALVAEADWTSNVDSPWRFFAYPAETMMLRVLTGRFYEAGLTEIADPPTFVAAATLVVTLAAAALVRTRFARWLPLLLAIPLASGVAQTQYTLHQYSWGPGNAGTRVADRAWVDRALPEGGRAAIYAVSRGREAESTEMWGEIQYFNTAMAQVFAFEAESPGVPHPVGTRGVMPTIDEESGFLRGDLTRYVVAHRTFRAVELDWERVAASPYQPADLMRIRRPRALYRVTGLQQATTVSDGAPATFRFWRDSLGPGRICARLGLHGPPATHPDELRKRVRFVLAHEQRTIARGSVPAATPARPITFEIPFGGRPYADVVVRSRGMVVSPDGIPFGLQMGGISFAPCRS